MLSSECFDIIKTDQRAVQEKQLGVPLGFTLGSQRVCLGSPHHGFLGLQRHADLGCVSKEKAI